MYWPHWPCAAETGAVLVYLLKFSDWFGMLAFYGLDAALGLNMNTIAVVVEAGCQHLPAISRGAGGRSFKRIRVICL